MTLPVNDPSFWRQRIAEASDNGWSLHKTVYHVDDARMAEIDATHRRVLRTALPAGTKVLEAGCGYGRIVPLLPAGVDYWGVDISADFIQMAKVQHYQLADRFSVQPAERLTFADQEFDVVLAVSVEGMIVDNLGVMAWRRMERELLRVGRKLILMSFGDPGLWREIASESDPEQKTINTIHLPGGSLQYLPTTGEVCCMFDLWVDADCRRQGVGRRLVESLQSLKYHSIHAFTRVDNHAARAFYESLGFVPHAVKDFYPGMSGILYVWTREV